MALQRSTRSWPSCITKIPRLVPLRCCRPPSWVCAISSPNIATPCASTATATAADVSNGSAQLASVTLNHTFFDEASGRNKAPLTLTRICSSNDCTSTRPLLPSSTTNDAVADVLPDISNGGGDGGGGMRSRLGGGGGRNAVGHPMASAASTATPAGMAASNPGRDGATDSRAARGSGGFRG